MKLLCGCQRNRKQPKVHTKLQCQTVQYAPSTTAKSAQDEVQIALSTEGKMHLAITKKNKSIKKELVENDLDVVSVIDYLNDKANKQFNATHFENYLEDSRVSDLPESSPPKPLELDFNKGEA